MKQSVETESLLEKKLVMMACLETTDTVEMIAVGLFWVGADALQLLLLRLVRLFARLRAKMESELKLVSLPKSATMDWQLAHLLGV